MTAENARQKAERLLDEMGGFTADDLAIPQYSAAAIAYSNLAVADQLERLNRKLEEITDGEGSVNTWAMSR